MSVFILLLQRYSNTLKVFKALMEVMEDLVLFFDHPFFIVLGGLTAVVSIVTGLYGVYMILCGVVPVWIRLGRGLANKKIAVYAENDFVDLRDLLLDSGLFKSKNIEQITSASLKKGERHTMMLVNFEEFSDKIKEILLYKKDSDSLIIYAPKTRIEQMIMEEINSNRNSIVVNFKGRLLNDILTSMITTTSYEKR